VWVHHFASCLAGWLGDSAHPGIARARTCADIGRHEQPVGVAVTLSDGWLWILQTVGTAPGGGDVNRSGESTRPEPFDGEWADRADYREARKAFEREQEAYDGPKTRLPQASVAALMGVALETVKRAGHPEVTSVEVPDGRLVLVVGFTDGSKAYGYPAGFIGPGATEMMKL
jgi:hypothetical protein